MDSLTHYQGKDVYTSIIESGRPGKAMHFLVAAIIAANKEKLTVDQLVGMLHEANSFAPPTFDRAETLKDLGFG